MLFSEVACATFPPGKTTIGPTISLINRFSSGGDIRPLYCSLASLIVSSLKEFITSRTCASLASLVEETPVKSLFTVTRDGLVKAAETVKDLAAPVLAPVGAIAKFIGLA